MKKLLFIALSSLPAIILHAQEPADALRSSWYVPGGSARVQAIGGAMGSLGGDITATFVNPAGLAFYKTGDFIITPKYQFQKTKASIYSRTETEKMNKFTLGTTGFVNGTDSRNNTSIKNTAF